MENYYSTPPLEPIRSQKNKSLGGVVILSKKPNWTFWGYLTLPSNLLFFVLFFPADCGGVDKVLESKSAAFIIAEYRPFAHRAHIDSIIHHPSSVSR